MANFETPIRKSTPVIFNLLIINGLVWLAQLAFDKTYGLTDRIALYLFQSEHFRPYQLITHMFAHAAYDENGHIVFEHILFNMFALWMFGSILERYWGQRRFLIFYLSCGIGAALFQQLLTPFTATQMARVDPNYLLGRYSFQTAIEVYKQTSCAIGASGAIMGVMAAFAYIFPNTELYIMFIPVPVKAKYVIPVLILLDLFGGFYHRQGDDVAHFAHLGGALIGFLIVYIRNKTDKKSFY